MARPAPIAAFAVASLCVFLAGSLDRPAAAQASPPFAETVPVGESVPQYLRQLAGRDLDDLLLGEGVAAQSGWVGGKYAFYLSYRGQERAPEWLTLSLSNVADQKAPLNLAGIVATLLSIKDRAAFLRAYDGRLSVAGPWRLCLARGGSQTLIHNRGPATFISFARRTLSADVDCNEVDVH